MSIIHWNIMHTIGIKIDKNRNNDHVKMKRFYYIELYLVFFKFIKYIPKITNFNI